MREMRQNIHWVFFAKAAVRVLRHEPGIIVMEDPGFVVPQLWPLASDKFT